MRNQRSGAARRAKTRNTDAIKWVDGVPRDSALSLSHSTMILHQDVLELTGTLKELVQRSQTVNRRTASLWNDLLVFLRWVWATCYSLILHYTFCGIEPFCIFLEHSVVHKENTKVLIEYNASVGHDFKNVYLQIWSYLIPLECFHVMIPSDSLIGFVDYV